MNLVTKIRNQLTYNPDTGELHWKENGSGRRSNLVAGSIKYTRGGHNVIRRIVLDGVDYTSAQVAWTIQEGEFPAFIIDRIDGDPLNDRWTNLRRGDGGVIQRNCRMSRRITTGVTGVRLNNGYYPAYIGDNGKQKYLGCSADFFEAVCIRKRAELDYNYSPRHGINDEKSPARANHSGAL